APRHRAAAPPRELARYPRGVAPGIGHDLALHGRIETRGEQRARLDLCRGHELRDREDLWRGAPIEIGIGHDSVGCPEIDPYRSPTARHGRTAPSAFLQPPAPKWESPLFPR